VSPPDEPVVPDVPEVPDVRGAHDDLDVAETSSAPEAPQAAAADSDRPLSGAVAPEELPAGNVAPDVADGAVAASIAMDQGAAEVAATVTATRDAQLAASRAKAGEAWQRVVAAHASGDTLLGAVVSIVKGGALVDIGGIRGFLPASQVRAPEGQQLDALLKTVLPLKILDIDASRRRAVVSSRRAIEAERRRKRSELLASLAPGQRREAVVMRLTEFGAFVDLGGVDGLIPMSELALDRVERASDVVTVGERLEVEVLRVDAGGKKISLSRKNALPDPWRDHAALLRVGNVVEGKVVAKEPRLSIELAPGVVGTMRDSDADPADYEIGETVEVAIRTADRRSRRLTLASPYAATVNLTQSSGFAPLGQELRPPPTR
jgi:ribosomal protein S1